MFMLRPKLGAGVEQGARGGGSRGSLPSVEPAGDARRRAGGEGCLAWGGM